MKLGARYAVVFFFFQAEDGIRDYKVTGVQTCALPILSAAQRRFVRLRNIPVQRGAVFLGKIRRASHGLFLSRSGTVHPLFSTQRVAITSASSIPRQQFAIILSTSFCGASSTESSSANSGRIPSVAKISTSPLAIGTASACKGGS